MLSGINEICSLKKEKMALQLENGNYTFIQQASLHKKKHCSLSLFTYRDQATRLEPTEFDKPVDKPEGLELTQEEHDSIMKILYTALKRNEKFLEAIDV